MSHRDYAFITTELHKNFKPLLAPGSSDDEKDRTKDILSKRFGLLEERLGDRTLILGDDMTTADCYLFVMLVGQGKGRTGAAAPSHRLLRNSETAPFDRPRFSGGGLELTEAYFS